MPLPPKGINVVGVHAEGHGKSLRVGQLLRLESLVANALVATAVGPREVRSSPTCGGL